MRRREALVRPLARCLALGLAPGLVAWSASRSGAAWAQSPPAAQAMPAPPEGQAPTLAHPELQNLWPQPVRLQGQARFRFFGLHIYDAQLWAPEALRVSRLAEQPLALALIYARRLEGARIAERSLDEMRRAGPLDEALAQRWLSQMRSLFPDVSEGDRITGVYAPGQGARFWFNGKLLGEVKEAEFARRFFGIWLAPHTSEAGLRQQLLAGLAA